MQHVVFSPIGLSTIVNVLSFVSDSRTGIADRQPAPARNRTLVTPILCEIDIKFLRPPGNLPFAIPPAVIPRSLTFACLLYIAFLPHSLRLLIDISRYLS